MWTKRGCQLLIPRYLVSGCGFKPQAVTSASRSLVIVIVCVNALGHSVPPCFVFPGVRMWPVFIEGGSPGADGTVTESGWSNSIVFWRYLEQHLLKYLPERSSDSPVLVMCDGHFHINRGLIDWAKTQHLSLFIHPTHTSHVMQPLDVGCFNPVKQYW